MTAKPLTQPAATKTIPSLAPAPDLLTVLTEIPRLGVTADERELLYQLGKAGHPAGADTGTLLTALAALEEQGLITVNLAARLTPAGRQAVADTGQAPPDETCYPPFPAPALEAKRGPRP